jgi:hypothetical protein
VSIDCFWAVGGFLLTFDRILENVVSTSIAMMLLDARLGWDADSPPTERDVDRDSRTQRQEGPSGEQGQVHQQDVGLLFLVDSCLVC